MNQIIPATPPHYLTEIQRDPHLKSEHTRRQYSSALRAFDAWRAERTITKSLVEEYAAHLQRGKYSINTIKTAVAAIKWWARKVADLSFENSSEETAREVFRQTERIASIRSKDVARGSRPVAGRYVTAQEFAALLDTCKADPTPAGARDAAFIAICIQTGARNEEVRGIRLGDMKYDGDILVVTIEHGKGDKSRVVHIHGNTLRAVNAWLDIRGAQPGHLFNPISKGGNALTSKQITYEGTRKGILQKRFQQSGLEKTMSWHDFRRSFDSNMLDNGYDPILIGRITGQTAGTVERYDRRLEERQIDAVRSIDVPY